jgi:hypothetical protein
MRQQLTAGHRHEPDVRWAAIHDEDDQLQSIVDDAAGYEKAARRRLHRIRIAPIKGSRGSSREPVPPRRPEW